MKIEWHARARLDLIEIVRYVAEENLEAALRLRSAIREQTALLGEMPSMGRRGRVRGTRELVIAGTRYIVAYASWKTKWLCFAYYMARATGQFSSKHFPGVLPG